MQSVIVEAKYMSELKQITKALHLESLGMGNLTDCKEN